MVREKHLIGYSFIDIEGILGGAQIRIFELTKNLGIPLIYGERKFTRLRKLIENLPTLFKMDNILLFDYCSSPYEFFFLNSLRKIYGLIFDIADIPHLQLLYFNYPINFDRVLLKKINIREKNFLRLFRMSDTLLFSSSTFPSMMNVSLKNKKVIIIPNASNPDHFKKSPIPREGKKVVLYVGGYAPMRGIDLLIEAFKLIRMKNKNVVLKLVGYNIPQELQRDGITVETNKYYFDMPEVYSQSNVCVIPHRKNPYMDAVLPIKLFDSMAAARPVVVTDCHEMSNIVKSEKCGLVAEENAESFAEAIDYLLSNESLSQEMGERGREAIEERHSWYHRALILIKKLKN